MKNLRIFKKLCGDQGLSCVVLATTMWSRPPTQEEVQREQELSSKESYWAGMIKKGSHVFRQDDGLASATRIVQFILSRRSKMTLEIQKEMAGGKTLDQTSAGQEVQAEIEKLKNKHEKEMKDLKKDFMEAQQKNDLRTQQEIMSMRREMERKMRESDKEREKMRVNMEQLSRQRERELLEANEKAHAQQLAHEKAMWKHHSEVESLKTKHDYEAKLHQQSLQSQKRLAEQESQRQEAENDRYEAELELAEKEQEAQEERHRREMAESKRENGGCTAM